MSTLIVMIVSIYSMQLSNVIGTKLLPMQLSNVIASATCTTEDILDLSGDSRGLNIWSSTVNSDNKEASQQSKPDQENGFIMENIFKIIFVLCILCIIANISPNKEFYISSRPLMNMYIFLTIFYLESICVVISQTPPPDNDQCSSAQCITVPSTFITSTVDATQTNPPFPTCGTAIEKPEPDVWFAFTADCNCVDIDTCGDATDYDTQLSLLGGCCDSLCCVDGSDDAECGIPDPNRRSRISTCGLTIGDTYYIVLHGFDFDLPGMGTAEISVTYPMSCEDTGAAVCSTCSGLICEEIPMVTICHKGKTLTISENALQAHLNHGDELGACSEDTGVDILQRLAQDEPAKGKPAQEKPAQKKPAQKQTAQEKPAKGSDKDSSDDSM